MRSSVQDVGSSVQTRSITTCLLHSGCCVRVQDTAIAAQALMLHNARLADLPELPQAWPVSLVAVSHSCLAAASSYACGACPGASMGVAGWLAGSTCGSEMLQSSRYLRAEKVRCAQGQGWQAGIWSAVESSVPERTGSCRVEPGKQAGDKVDSPVARCGSSAAQRHALCLCQ